MNQRDYEASERLRTVIDECERIVHDERETADRRAKARHWLDRLLFHDSYWGYPASSMRQLSLRNHSGGDLAISQELRYEGWGERSV